MTQFMIVAHRGIPQIAPENTIPSFQAALDLEVEAVELDVRLTRDQVPVVYHYFNLEKLTSGSGAIFNRTLAQLRELRILEKGEGVDLKNSIPTLEEVLETFAGKIGLEIHLQGPEPESARLVGELLKHHRQHWDQIEVNSYNPAMLLLVHEECPGLATDFLMPKTEPWMTPEIITYQALHQSRLARARAAHLHHTQLSEMAVETFRENNFDIHTWDVNDRSALESALKLGISRVCTDEVSLMLDLRRSLASTSAGEE